MSVPRNEYPRPQFVRPEWICLNGPWQFEVDRDDTGLERGLRERELSGRITVPFCPESPLSGVGETDFLNAVWYRRKIVLPREWAGRRALVHFQAVDYDATVWADGAEVGRHRGGFTPITCDLGVVPDGGREVTLVVRARDDHRRLQPKGKQCHEPENFGCLYTRTTGIWQTVWLEPVPAACRLERPRITPDVGGSRLIVEQPLVGDRRGLRLRAMLGDARGCAVAAECDAASDFFPRLVLEIPADRVRLWSPDDPHLYELEIELLNSDGAVVDRATSYAGLRSVTIDGPAILINGRAIFQRLVLDQGYYPDGIMTAPSDEALRRDIELSLAVGFNGARLHQKIFEERFLYHADRMGYLVWGEFPDWGCRSDRDGRPWQEPEASYITQWLEALARDYSHPSIVGWCPLNETCQELTDGITALDDVTRGMFLATRAMDATRPVIDASGYSHRVPEADVYDSHDYVQDVATFKARHDASGDGRPFVNAGKDGQPWSIPWRGQPLMISEFGGTWWQPGAPQGESSWGYGQRPQTLDEFYERFEGLCGALLDNEALCGYCYTELTDVYQEQNGLYGFDREAKFDADRLRAVQQRPAAIERRDTTGRDA